MTNKTINIFALSQKDTNVVKGIAIIAMLCHHVYGCQPEWIESYPILLKIIGIIGKVCVSMFLFCSGYGLTVQYDKLITLASGFKNKISATIGFLFKRLIKFYSAYWFVFLIFVPISVLFFSRPLSEAYGADVNILKHVMLDFLGLQGFLSYNITWWFNRLIIILYVTFPVLYFFLDKTKWIGLLVSFVFMMLSNRWGLINYYDLMLWQWPFILGIGWAMYENKLSNLSNKMNVYPLMVNISIVLVLIFGIIQRQFNIIPYLNINGVKFDGFLTIIILLFVITILRKLKYIYILLSYLGKHSINIYLIHTFLNLYWIPIHKLLHTNTFCRFGGINMWILLFSCLTISIILEYVKYKLGWRKLTEQILYNIKAYEYPI